MDDQVFDLAVAGGDEDADPVRVGALAAVGRRVADADLFFAERPADHRGRAATVEVDRRFDAFGDHVFGLDVDADAAVAGAAGTVPGGEDERVAAVLEADRGARRDRRFEPGDDFAFFDDLAAVTDRELEFLRGGVAEFVAEGDGFADFQRPQCGGRGAAADQGEAARRDFAGAGARRVDRGDLVFFDQDFGDFRGDAGEAAEAAVGAPFGL